MNEIGAEPRSVDLEGRLKPGPTDVLLFSKGGLRERAEEATRGDAPKDFYYGLLGLLADGIDARMLSFAEPYANWSGPLRRGGERVWARLTGISRRHHVLRETAGSWAMARVVVSFADQFSLTMGDYFRRHRCRPRTVGLFHGLSDLEKRLTSFGQLVGRSYIRTALAGLDRLGFFGPADLEEAVRAYGLSEDQVQLVRFGVDTDFWRPVADRKSVGTNDDGFFVVSVGSDPNRDYETLVAAGLDCPVHIVTRLPVTVTSGRSNIRVTTGSYADSQLTDKALRHLYQTAGAVVVPLHDVFQPSGYSVTLQAMACGCPVILTRNRGLWAPEFYVDRENCLLVRPGDPDAIREATTRLRADPGLAEEIGRNARTTVERHFPLHAMDDSLRTLVQAVDPALT